MNYSTHKFYVKQAMRNQYLLIVFLLAGLLGYGQQYNYVSIDDTYTVDQLVKDVLVGADCDLVSNVTYQYCDGSPGSYDVYPLRSEEHTSELQSRPHLVCRLLLEKKKRRGIRPLFVWAKIMASLKRRVAVEMADGNLS